MQTPSTPVLLESVRKSQMLDWSLPHLLIESIATITKNGSVSITDGCANCGRDGT